jgi:hypothetical protein
LANISFGSRRNRRCDYVGLPDHRCGETLRSCGTIPVSSHLRSSCASSQTKPPAKSPRARFGPQLLRERPRTCILLGSAGCCVRSQSPAELGGCVQPRDRLFISASLAKSIPGDTLDRDETGAALIALATTMPPAARCFPASHDPGFVAPTQPVRPPQTAIARGASRVRTICRGRTFCPKPRADLELRRSELIATAFFLLPNETGRRVAPTAARAPERTDARVCERAFAEFFASGRQSS